MTDNSFDFSGVWTAIITPFHDDGSIDWTAFERLVASQVEGGVTGIVVAGTTGEGPTLGHQEKLALVRKARTLLSPSMRLMAGTGGNNTEQSVELSRLAADAGADSLLIVTPPYNKPSPAGLHRHFSCIAEAVRLPLCLYHVPGRTGQTLTPDTMASLCQIPSVRAVKEASGDIAFFSRARLRSRVQFLSGDDATFLASLSVGGSGVISVVSNVFPRETVALHTAFGSSNPEKARALHDALLPFVDILFCESNPGPVKAALHAAGLSPNVLRAPLAPVTRDNFEKIVALLTKTREALRLLP